MVLDVQDVDPVLLRKVGDLGASPTPERRRDLLGADVRDVVQSPVEDLDEEREFLQDPARQVAGEPGSIERRYRHPTEAACPLWRRRSS